MARPERARRGRIVASWVAMASLGASACLGGVARVYDDGGSDAGIDTAVVPDVQSADSGAGVDAGSGGDVTADVDAPSDGNVPDAASEAEAGQVFSCNGQPVTSCAACVNDTLECVFCAQDGGHPGVCAPKGMLCHNSAPTSSAVCDCTSAASCAAPFQVCTNFGPSSYCQTCGEQGSDGHPCKGGGSCDETAGMCH